jgi:hypothetical protein
MPATYEPIASVTLSSSASSVTLGSGGTIPQTYTDLVLVHTPIPVTADDRGISTQFNGDTGSNYSETELYGLGSSAGSQRLSSSTSIRTSRAIGFLGTYVGITHFMSYANTNVFKTVLHTGANAGAGVTRTVGLWRSTSAITSITLTSGSPNSFATGSTFSLYGIKAA